MNLVNSMDQLFCEINCISEVKIIQLFDLLVSNPDKVRETINENNLLIWEPYDYMDMVDFVDYLGLLAKTAQDVEFEVSDRTIKAKWKRYVIEEYVASYDKSISKENLFDEISKDGVEAMSKHRVVFFTRHDGMSGKNLINAMVFQAMRLQQVDSELPENVVVVE